MINNNPIIPLQGFTKSIKMLTPKDKFPEGKPPPGCACGIDGAAPYKPAAFGGGGMPT